MRILHGVSASPFVRKVRLVLETKKLEYQMNPIIPKNVSDDFKKISPLGKIPALTDGDINLCDSNVICDYLENIYPEPSVYPKDPHERAQALWINAFSLDCLSPHMVGGVFFQKLIGPMFFDLPTEHEVLKQALEVEIPKACEYLESQLPKDQIYFVGKQFSIADIAVLCPIVNLLHAGHDIDHTAFPKLSHFTKTHFARPEIQRIIEEEKTLFSAV